MKKLSIALAIASLAASTAFAADLSVSGTVVDTHQLGGVGSSAAAYSFGKSRVIFSMKADDKVSVTYIGTVDTASLNKDYAYADITNDFGKLRVGTIYQNIANFGGGLYQTNTFLAKTVCKAPGISLSTKVADYNINLFNINSAIGADALKVYGVKADTVMSGVNLAVVAQAAIKNDASDKMQTGPAIELEASTKIADAKLSGQVYTELNDNAAIARSATKKATYIGLYGEYDLSNVTMKGCSVYADYVSGSGDGRALDSELKIGVNHACNAKTTLNLEAKSVKGTTGDAVGSTAFGVQVKF